MTFWRESDVWPIFKAATKVQTNNRINAFNKTTENITKWNIVVSFFSSQQKKSVDKNVFLFFVFKKIFTYSVHNKIHIQTTTENKWNKEQSKYGEGTQELSGYKIWKKNYSGLHYINGFSVLNFVFQVLACLFWFSFIYVSNKNWPRNYWTILCCSISRAYKHRMQ